MFAYFSPCSEWVPRGNTVEIKAEGKELATLLHILMAQDKCSFTQTLPYQQKYM